MGTENKTEEDKGEKIEEPKNLLDNDTLRKLVNEEIPYEDLTNEQREEFHSRFVEGDEEGVPTVEEEAQEKAKSDEGSTPNDSQPQTPNLNNDVTPVGSEDADKSEILAKLKAEKDASNTLKQRLDSANEKLRAIQANKLPEPPKIEDALDDNLTKQDEWNRKLAASLNAKAESEAEAIQKDRAETAQSLLYSDISILQTENPELRTSLPVETIDKTYVRFRDGLAGAGASNEQKNEAVSKYFSDAEFRKSKESEGHVFPIGEKDWKGYQTVSKLIQYKRNGGSPTWDSQANGDKYSEMDVAYYKWKKENGIIPDPVKQAAIDTASKVADQMADRESQPSLLSPEVGKVSGELDGMTEAQAEQWLVDHPTATTPQEMATLQAILKKFSPSASSSPNANHAPQDVVF